jgi:NEDD8-activating enzyme E1 regulatory subunit
MKAQSEVYVRLQNIYKAKARQDVAKVKKLVELHPQGGEVDFQEIETYCKNAAFIKLIRSTEPSSNNLKALAGKYTCVLFITHLTSIDAELNAEFAISPTLIPIYLALKASEMAAVPTEDEVSKVVENAAGDERLVQAAQEVARARGGELHNISALTGGMVSQEIIKVITKQYIPIDDTCIFDGIKGRTQILKIQARCRKSPMAKV